MLHLRNKMKQKKSLGIFLVSGLKRVYYKTQTPKKNGDSSLNHTLLLVSSQWEPVFLFLFNFFVEENGNESEPFPGLGHSVNIVVFWDYVWSFVSYFISSFWVAL